MYVCVCIPVLQFAGLRSQHGTLHRNPESSPVAMNVFKITPIHQQTSTTYMFFHLFCPDMCWL